MSLADAVTLNLAFLAVALLLLGVAQYAWRNAAPVAAQPLLQEPLFKVWMVIIWTVGIFLPVGVILWDWLASGGNLAALTLGPYLAMIFVQVGVEWTFWFGFNRSVVWGLVPCFFLPWRLFQLGSGLHLLQGTPDTLLLQVTLAACFILWVINIGVHYSGIPAIFGWRSGSIEAESRARERHQR